MQMLHRCLWLQDYESYGGLGVNWVMFGSSGHKTRPKGGTIASYWQVSIEESPRHPRFLAR
jgi:hypothetical protein